MEDTLHRLGELGVDHILEVGPGSALAGFVKKTLPGVVCASVETPEQLNAMLSGGTVPGMAAASANYNEQEDTDHEE